MNIAKYFEEGVALTTNNAQMIIIKRSVDCYSIEISRNSDNERIRDNERVKDDVRVFVIPFSGLMDQQGLKTYYLFENFISNMFGNNILHGEYKSSNIIFNTEEKRIILFSDSGNGAVLSIKFDRDEIRLEIKKIQENDYNHAIYCYSDANLRGGFIRMFKDLYEELNKIALEPTRPQERIRANNNN